MEIKVLGPGCPKCKQTEQNVKAAVAETGLPEWALPAGILAGAGLLAFALMSQKKGRRR